MKLNRFSLTSIPSAVYGHRIYEHFRLCLKTKKHTLIKKVSIGLVDFEIRQIDDKIKIAESLHLAENKELLEIPSFRDFLDSGKAMENQKRYLISVREDIINETWQY